MRMLIVFLCLFLVACSSTRLYIGAAHKLRSSDFEGAGPAAVFRVSGNLSDNVSCELMHVSHWFTGPPFNDREEDSLDTIGCGYSFDLQQLTNQ